MPERTDTGASNRTLVAGRYALKRTLGSGGMSEVYAARDTVLERDVAVKLFGPAVDAAGPDRERSEMRTLAGLTHPRLVTVHDAGSDTPEHGRARAFLVMELIDGPSVATLLRDGPLPPEQVARVGAGVADALDYIHGRGVVHRDVKPANILLDQRGEPHLADFGIAQTLGDAALTQTGMTIGTAAYLSPEQVRGQTATPASDIYALGLVLLEALTGRREYRGVTAEAALARLTRPPVIDPALPTLWPQLLTAMTATDPGARPGAAEVAFALETGVYDGPAVGDPTATIALPAPGTVRAGDATTKPVDTGAAGGDAGGQTRVARRSPTISPSGSMPVRRSSPRRTGQWSLPLPGASRRTMTITAMAVGVLLLVILAVSALGGRSSSSSGTGGAPTGPPGASRLGPDLTRLHQLVQP